MKSSVFWDIKLRSPLKINRQFAGKTSGATCFMLVSCLAYSSTLKLEAAILGYFFPELTEEDRLTFT
jgi:hypothetical protein